MPLSKHILGNLGIKYDMKPILSSEAINQLYTYNWPGNVRELENILERSLFLSNNGEILEIAIPLGAAKDKSITSDYTNIKLRSIRKQAINAAELPVLEKILLIFMSESCGINF